MTAFDVRGKVIVLGTFTTREKAVRFTEKYFELELEINRTNISWLKWFRLKLIGM